MTTCAPAATFLMQLLFGDCILYLIKKYWRGFIVGTITTAVILLLVESGKTKELKD